MSNPQILSFHHVTKVFSLEKLRPAIVILYTVGTLNDVTVVEE